MYSVDHVVSSGARTRQTDSQRGDEIKARATLGRTLNAKERDLHLFLRPQRLPNRGRK